MSANVIEDQIFDTLLCFDDWADEEAIAESMIEAGVTVDKQTLLVTLAGLVKNSHVRQQSFNCIRAYRVM
jgi:hypothetical protein